MKKLFAAFLIVLITISLIGYCSKKNSFSSGQQQAITNCIDFIKNSSSFVDTRDSINTKIIKIKNADKDTWRYVSSVNINIDEKSINTTDWVITIGNTSASGFGVLVCSSTTYQVIGFIPIQ